MATSATSGYGVKLKRGDGGGPETFTDIAEVMDIEGPSLKMDLADATNQDSAGRFKEFVPTLLDGGEVGLTLNFLPADATQSYSAGVLQDMINRTKRNFKIVFSNAGSTAWTFAAYVTEFAPSAPVGERLTAKVTLKLTGQPTLA